MSAVNPEVIQNAPAFHWAQGARKPNLKLLIGIMAVVFALTIYLQIKPSDAGVAGANVQNIPYERGDWKCVNENFTDTGLMSQLGADAYTLRYYINQKTKQQVELYVVYRRYGRREFNHNPDQCFPAGGYQMVTRETGSLPWGGTERPVVKMYFDGSRVANNHETEGVPDAVVSYFFASGGRTEHQFLKQQLLMATERFVPNRNGWALIRLNTPKSTTGEEAFAAQVDFMKTFGSTIEEVITTDKVHDQQAAL